MKFKERIKIKNKWIGGGQDPCFIIAEAGSNHNRDFKTAKKLIDAAYKAGVDAVKFQTYSAGALYQKEKKAFDMLKKIELPMHWHKLLADYAQKKGLIFLSTPFYKGAIDQLNPIVPAFKWASPEIIDRPLLEYAAKKGKPLIISTAFYGLKEVEDALKWVKSANNKQVAIMHCTGEYPAPYREVNLKAIRTLKKFKVPVGFSDHTMDIVVPAAAVAMGAKLIEKHFTLNRKMTGPDHPFALEPNELKEMVKNIRNVEKSLGSGVKKPSRGEEQTERVIRRGIVAAEPIKKGQKITINKMTTKRVGAGAILPADFYKIIGKKAKKNIKPDGIIVI